MVIIEDKYLTAQTLEELKDKSFTFANPGAMEQMSQADGKTKPKLVIGIKLSNEKLTDWIPNNTCLKVLRKKYGNDTNLWTGKKAVFEVVKQNVRGELKDVIFVQK